jgi:hypothetical protein
MAAPRRRHWSALVALSVVVALLHLWLTSEVASRLDEQNPPGGKQRIQRMEATYVSEMHLSAPPVVPVAGIAPPAAPKPKARRPAKAKAASAPEEAKASAAELASSTASDEAQASKLAQAASAPADSPVASSVAASSAASASVAVAAQASVPDSARNGPAFVWPKASRVSFKLVGYFRGPIEGKAAVEWVRQADRYQVHLDAAIAPFGGVSMISEGVIKAEGLQPARYENTTHKLIGKDTIRVVELNEAEVVMPTGDRLPRPEGIQDAVSQLIHLAYQFMMNPALAKQGQSVALKVALVRKIETIVYEVVGEETLDTPIGQVPTLHIKPRRVVAAQANAQPDLGSIEVWLAPGLQYLPVRILTKMDGDNHLDMLMERAPQQVPGDEPGRPASGSN